MQLTYHFGGYIGVCIAWKLSIKEIFTGTSNFLCDLGPTFLQLVIGLEYPWLS